MTFILVRTPHELEKLFKMSNHIVWTNLRMRAMTLSGVSYGSKIYGDKLSPETVTICGTKKRRDKVMLEAFENKTPVLVTIHVCRGKLLPKRLGIGKIKEIHEGQNGLRKFIISFDEIFHDEKHQVGEKNPDERSQCWIKRAFMKKMGLTPVGNNLITCAIKCKRS